MDFMFISQKSNWEFWAAKLSLYMTNLNEILNEHSEDSSWCTWQIVRFCIGSFRSLAVLIFMDFMFISQKSNWEFWAAKLSLYITNLNEILDEHSEDTS
jgi:hypothetical protein